MFLCFLCASFISSLGVWHSRAEFAPAEFGAMVADETLFTKERQVEKGSELPSKHVKCQMSWSSRCFASLSGNTSLAGEACCCLLSQVFSVWLEFCHLQVVQLRHVIGTDLVHHAIVIICDTSDDRPIQLLGILCVSIECCAQKQREQSLLTYTRFLH